jgi:hypothetical protein
MPVRPELHTYQQDRLFCLPFRHCHQSTDDKKLMSSAMKIPVTSEDFSDFYVWSFNPSQKTQTDGGGTFGHLVWSFVSSSFLCTFLIDFSS